MSKYLVLLLSISLCPLLRAQESQSVDTLDGRCKPGGGYHFPADLSITMSDGHSKKVSEIRPGDPVRCIKSGVLATTLVREVERVNGTGTWLTALYLRPVDEQTLHQEDGPLVPAILLEASPTLSLTTPNGFRTVAQLKKGDILYRYEPATRQVSAWKVGLIHNKARRVTELYSFVTEEGSFLLGNRIALAR